MHFGQFLRAWAASMPAGSVTAPPAPDGSLAFGVEAAEDGASAGPLHLGLLRGLVLQSQPPGSIRYFPHFELSPEPAARFRELFAVRSRWAEADLKPFIEPLVGYGRTEGDLLITYARSTKQGADGPRIFSAK
jgi:hypothetical protein